MNAGTLTDDELDEKLARLGARVADRNGRAREELAAIGALDLAEACRERFGARLVFLKTPRLEIGKDWPQGHPYNFDLKGHAHAPAKKTEVKPAPAKRRGKRPAYRPAPRTWHDFHD